MEITNIETRKEAKIEFGYDLDGYEVAIRSLKAKRAINDRHFGRLVKELHMIYKIDSLR